VLQPSCACVLVPRIKEGPWHLHRTSTEHAECGTFMRSIDMARPFVKTLHRTEIKNQHQVDSCPNCSLNLRPREFQYLILFFW
jgi:hypothetical protein